MGQVEVGKSYTCGNTVVFLPTASTFPASDFKVQMGRLNFINKRSSSLTLVDLTGGLSSNTEFCLKLSLEETGSLSKYSSFGFGGKLILPFDIPLVKGIALWSESILTPLDDSLSYLPQDILRGGVATNFDVLSLETTLLAGITRANNTVRPLTGIGFLIPATDFLKLGSEVLYNYYGRKETQSIVTGNVRVISNINIQISSGYISSRQFSSWLYSVGISFTTADIDFSPQIETQKQNLVPSFEEIEKQSSQEEQKEEPK